MNPKGLIVMPSSARTDAGTTALRYVANRPIACHAADALADAGIEEVAIVGPARDLDLVAECVAEDTPDARLTFLRQGERPGLLGALSRAQEFVAGSPAIVHFGDGLLGQQLHDVVQGRRESGLPDMLLLLHRSQSRHGLPLMTQRLLGLSELNGPGDRLAVAGVCAFGPRALGQAVGTPPDLAKINLIGIAEHLSTGGRRIEAEIVRGWRRFRGDPADLLELNRIVLDQQVVSHEIIDRADNRIEGRAVIHPTAEVSSSIILGPCLIGPHARVEGSYIGPYTSIGPRSVIEGAEIVRSIIAEDVSIRHVGTRIEGSTIGRGASIFRDFGLPRAMRLHVGDAVEIALN
jgi:glucose-1-phosphate thymidylyltransferase